MAEGQVDNEAGDLWLADQLVSNLGLEGAVQFCRVRAWDGVLDHLSQTELAVRAVQRARPDMTASDALTAVNLVRRE